jgi:hypothetical protein
MKTVDMKRLALGTILGGLCLALTQTATAALPATDFRNAMRKLL